jgi:hypothetical protein
MNAPAENQPSRQPLPPSGSALQKRRGVALILVIAFIVLLSALVVAFFSRVTTELAGASTYAEGVTVRQLADTSVSVVMGQIRSATTVPNAAWASQPGMIRTYANGSAGATVHGPNAFQFFKLYSSHDLIVSATEMLNFDPNNYTAGGGANTEVPLGVGGWLNQQAYFVDLNEPVAVQATILNPVTGLPMPGTRLRYPIFDPGDALNPISTISNVPGGATTPAQTGKMEGSEVDQRNFTLAEANKNVVPMPVRWLYVLKDGTLTAPPPLPGAASGAGAASTGLVAAWVGSGTGIPTRDNPIVGRIAFWTDDETCKVNINTAAGFLPLDPATGTLTNENAVNYSMPNNWNPPVGGTGPYDPASVETNAAFIAGSFWDTPRIETFFDRGRCGGPVYVAVDPTTGSVSQLAYPDSKYARTFAGGLANSQVCAREYQRYPGHPSTTSLGLVLKGLLPPVLPLTAIPSIDNQTPHWERLYAMTPRVIGAYQLPDPANPSFPLQYGSRGGTSWSDTHTVGMMEMKGSFLVTNPPPPIPTLPTRPVYEYLLQAPPSPNPPIGVPNATTYPPATASTNPLTFHFYASLDEMAFSTINGDRTNTDPALSIGPAPVTAFSGLISPTLVDQSRFFLTAHNRAPELNLFGKPRVAIWPVQTYRRQYNLFELLPPVAPAGTNIKNMSDELIRFCSTVGYKVGYTFVSGVWTPNETQTPLASDPNQLLRPGQFIFDREDPYSSPSGANSNDMSTTVTPRNIEIFKYLQSLCGVGQSGTVGHPGFTPVGTNLFTKYSAGSGGQGISQILAEIFDYIRCVNLKDTTRDKKLYEVYGSWHYGGPTSSIPMPTPAVANYLDIPGKMYIQPDQDRPSPNVGHKKYQSRYAPRGLVVPIKFGNPLNTPAGTVTGMGRWPTIAEAAIIFYHGGYIYQASSTVPPAAPVWPAPPAGEDVIYDLSLIDPQVGKFSGMFSAFDPEFPTATDWLNGRAADPTKTPPRPAIPAHKLTGKLVRAFMVFETFNPGQGYAPTSGLDNSRFETLQYRVTSMSAGTAFGISTPSWAAIRSLGSRAALAAAYGSQTTTPWATWILQEPMNFVQTMPGNTAGGRNFGGAEGFMHTIVGKSRVGQDPTLPTTTTPGSQRYYPFQSPCVNKDDGVRVAMTDTTFRFQGGTITLQISYSDKPSQINAAYSVLDHTTPQIVQTLNLVFPDSSAAGSYTWPLPVTELEATPTSYTQGYTIPRGGAWWRDRGGFDPTTPGYNIADWASDPVGGSPSPPTPPGGPGVNHNWHDWIITKWGNMANNPVFGPNIATAKGSDGAPYLGITDFGISPVTNLHYQRYCLGNPGWPGSIVAPWTGPGNGYIGVPSKADRTRGGATAAHYYWNSSGWAMVYHMPGRLSWAQQHSYGPWGSADTWPANIPPYSIASGGMGFRWTGGDDKHYWNRGRQLLQPGDTIRSLVLGSAANPGYSDPRVPMLSSAGAPSAFQAHPRYLENAKDGNPRRRAEQLRNGDGTFTFDPQSEVGSGGVGTFDTAPTTGYLVPGWAQGPVGTPSQYRGFSGPYLPRGPNAGPPFTARMDRGAAAWADFDSGIGNCPDGGYFNKADEGNLARYWIDYPQAAAQLADPLAPPPVPQPPIVHWVEPYYNTWVYDAPLDTYFSPNRQIPGPGMFGSLLAGQTVNSNSGWEGWKTLLFCPNPASAQDASGNAVAAPTSRHPGALSPPDHLLLDLFWMPVVEPYAISEPFSTEGKVNLNYQIMPFGYIKRSTALRAVLHGMRVTAVPHFWTNTRKEFSYKGQANPENVRYLVDRDNTIRAIDDFFQQYNKGTVAQQALGFFKSASQICERFLYPKGAVFVPASQTNANPTTTLPGMPNAVKQTITYAWAPNAQGINATPDVNGVQILGTFWKYNALTGDNLREKPYTDLYPRLTTKSNTFTVHYRVQTVRQRPYPGAASNAAAMAAWYKIWDEKRDQVISEFRGSTTIERYLDPQDPRFRCVDGTGVATAAALAARTYAPNSIKIMPATATTPSTTLPNAPDSLETAYQFKVINNKRFQPW